MGGVCGMSQLGWNMTRAFSRLNSWPKHLVQVVWEPGPECWRGSERHNITLTTVDSLHSPIICLWSNSKQPTAHMCDPEDKLRICNPGIICILALSVYPMWTSKAGCIEVHIMACIIKGIGLSLLPAVSASSFSKTKPYHDLISLPLLWGGFASLGCVHAYMSDVPWNNVSNANGLPHISLIWKRDILANFDDPLHANHHKFASPTLFCNLITRLQSQFLQLCDRRRADGNIQRLKSCLRELREQVHCTFQISLITNCICNSFLQVSWQCAVQN